MPGVIAIASAYDAAGRQVGTVDALGNLVTYQYDAASRQTLRIDGRGLRTSYSYDAASRLIGQQYQDGTRLTNTLRRQQPADRAQRLDRGVYLDLRPGRAFELCG